MAFLSEEISSPLIPLISASIFERISERRGGSGIRMITYIFYQVLQCIQVGLEITQVSSEWGHTLKDLIVGRSVPRAVSGISDEATSD